MSESDALETGMITLSEEQLAIANAPRTGSIWLQGEAGTGKTTAGVQRLCILTGMGIPADSILVLVPQRSLADAFFNAIHDPDFPSGGLPSILTFGGLAQRMVSLFWPIIAKEAGFKAPNRPPRFLTLETAQYYLATLVQPLIQQGYFESVTIDPNRLYSQILDNLNKSASVGFPPDEIASRLIQAWAGKPTQAIIYQQAQECALLFRNFCYKNNLLDFSLQLSVFADHLWPSMIFKEYLHRTYRYLIYDNIEEDIPVAHDLVTEWLPDLDSALLIQDTGGGFRTFLGADPVSSNRLAETCTGKIIFNNSLVKSPALQELEETLSHSILSSERKPTWHTGVEKSFSTHSFRFYPEVLDWTVDQISSLINDKAVNPGEIAILTPFLSDSLRFSFSTRLVKAGIPFSTYRPSRSLVDEPAVRTMLTFARLANPSWGLKPSQQEVRNAFLNSIEGCDLVRADLLSRTRFLPNASPEFLGPFDKVIPEMQARITYLVGERYEILRNWLNSNRDQGDQTLDHWISRLFGEVLSQPGFGFHSDFDSASSVSRLIESCRKFRLILLPTKTAAPASVGSEYIRVLEQGILAAQSLTAWTEQIHADSVFLSPAFSFLMSNRPVKYQFWIDIGSQGWWSRLDQPLTQAFVLNRNWEQGRIWTDADENVNNQKTLARVTSGLIRRCSDHIYMCTIEMNEQGLEERGALVMAVQNILRELRSSSGEHHV